MISKHIQFEKRTKNPQPINRFFQHLIWTPTNPHPNRKTPHIEKNHGKFAGARTHVSRCGEICRTRNFPGKLAHSNRRGAYSQAIGMRSNHVAEWFSTPRYIPGQRLPSIIGMRNSYGISMVVYIWICMGSERRESSDN